jgi:carbamoyltransferase
MGLAPFGEPRYAPLIREKLIDLKDDGSFRLDLRYFRYAQGLRMTSPAFHALFGGPPRPPESEITQREMDLAASIQQVTEDIVLRMARHARQLTGQKHLVMSGGVALNCVANGALQRAGIFDDIWIPSAAGDAGGALGAALLVAHQLLDAPRVTGRDRLQGSRLGPKYSNPEIRALLDAQRAQYEHFPGEQALLEVVARALGEGQVVGWFQDRMEFGPRALGCRSILGDARNPAMQSRMNVRIKFRENFRPFAPSCLAEDADHWFHLDHESPYMLFVAPVREEHRLTSNSPPSAPENSDLCQRMNIPRSSIPAVTHVDYSARIQTVTEERNGRFARLLREFKRQTGCGLLANTSFNIRGEPIVCTPSDAWHCFMACDMDLLVLENCVLRKSEQRATSLTERQEYYDRFALD